MAKLIELKQNDVFKFSHPETPFKDIYQFMFLGIYRGIVVKNINTGKTSRHPFNSLVETYNPHAS